MPSLLYPPSRPLSVGEVLDLAFRIYSTTLLKCLPYSFATVIIGQLLTVYGLLQQHATGARPALQTLQHLRDPLWWLLLILLGMCNVVLTSAVLLRQYALASGRPAAMRAELARGLRCMPGLLLAGLLMGLAIGGSLLPVLLLVGAVGAGLGVTRGRVAGPLVGLLLMIGYVVAASWAVIRWICTGPAYLLSQRGPVESMVHSWRLTQGNFWRLSAIYAVALILIVVFYMFVGVVGMVVALLVGRGDVTIVMALSQALVALLAAVFTPFYHALVLAVFGDLSARREGTDLAQRLAVPALS
jgi:Membrane domain of glycerophosphoryl diester phosphodiesterase